MKLLIGTNIKLLSLCLLMLRGTAGIILFITGSGKTLQWFHGFGMDATIQFFSQMGFSSFWAYVSSYTEFIGGFLLMIGFLTRPAAIAVFINMLVATIVAWPNGFVSQQPASFPFSLMISALVVILAGPMMFSVDYLLQRTPLLQQQKAGNKY